MKKKIQIPPLSDFSGPPSKPIKLPSPLICILSEFSSSWKIPNVGSRLWLLQGHNLSTIIYNSMKSAKLSNTIYLHKWFIQCTGEGHGGHHCIYVLRYSFGGRSEQKWKCFGQIRKLLLYLNLFFCECWLTFLNKKLGPRSFPIRW